jgi:hypothetical protein
LSAALANAIGYLLSKRRYSKISPVLEATAVGYATFYCNWPVLERLLSLKCLGNTSILPLSGYDSYKALLLGRTYWLTEGYKKQFWHGRCSSWIRCSPLVPAILAGEWKVVRALVRAGYRPDALSLLVAIPKVSAARVSKLLSLGVDLVNAHTRHDLDTPLQFAARM